METVRKSAARNYLFNCPPDVYFGFCLFVAEINRKQIECPFFLVYIYVYIYIYIYIYLFIFVIKARALPQALFFFFFNPVQKYVNAQKDADPNGGVAAQLLRVPNGGVAAQLL